MESSHQLLTVGLGVRDRWIAPRTDQLCGTAICLA
jgi:hypothetical protein